MGDDYDIFLGLLWMKLGTPTNKAGAGTEQEFMRAYNRFKENPNLVQVLFYFKNEPPKSLDDINLNELGKVKASIGAKNILYWGFDTCENLKGFLRIHIPKRIDSLIVNQSKPLVVDSKPITEVVENQNDDLGVLDYNEMFDNYLVDASRSLEKIAEATNWIGKEISIKTNEITRVRNTLLKVIAIPFLCIKQYKSTV